MTKAKEKVTRLLAVVMSAMLVLSLTAVSAFAAQEGELTGGSITIDNAVSGQTYSVYQILYLESYSTDADGNATGAYAYKANSAWADWLKTQTSYVSIDAQGYVTWKDQEYSPVTKETDGYKDASDDDIKAANETAQDLANQAGAADFAKAAQAHAKQQGMTSDATAVTASSATVSFAGLRLGYYLVDSTLGTLCSLDTTNPSVTIKEKNEAPTNEKKVQEGTSWGSSNDANIGDTVKFQSTITAQADAQNYVFHDKMDDGLTFGGSVTVTLNNQKVSAEVTNADGAANYTFTDYTAEGATASTDGCTFEVAFTQAFCDTLKKDDKIVISYTATLNENAVVGGDGNKNESWLKYGDSSETTKSTTTTYTWDVDVFKYTEGEADDEGKKLEVALADATFTLSKKADGTDPIALIREKDADSKDTNTYRVAKTGTVAEIITDDTGKFTVKGLDSGTYYLTETAAPAGYNKLAGPITVVIDDEGNTKVDSTVVNEVKVLNQTGAELPSTGGMGTTMLYVVGGILVVGAGVALVVRRRMGGVE